AGCLEVPREVGVMMVEAFIEPESGARVFALLAPPRDAHHVAAADLADLTDDGADGAGRCTYHQRLAGPRLTNVEKTDVSGEPRHSQHSEGVGRSLHGRIDFHQVAPVRDTVVLPAHVRDNQLAGMKS